ncbi:type III-A CRISPR-associated RAMP protein Csm3 [bacterium]|nr:type III-A CRISPR-associated RAMP protein Csm3 [bacterium]
MTEKENKNLEFYGKVIIELKIKAETGLHIGGSSEVAKIGGVDNCVIRDPNSNLPYIPGSSLKGKVRSLLEKFLGKVSEDGEVHSCKETNCEICRVFGSKDLGEGRVIFRDFSLTENSKKELEKKRNETGSDTEIKVENVINRLTSQSTNLRTIERVPKGTEFKGEIIYNFVKKLGQDDFLEKDLKNLFAGLKLLQDDYLGGSGSRGYGKVKIDVGEVKVRKRDYYFGKKEEERKIIEKREEKKEERKGDENNLGIDIEKCIKEIEDFFRNKIKPE